MLANSKKTNSARTRKDTHIKLHEDGLLGNYLLSDKKNHQGIEQGTLATRACSTFIQ